MFKKYILNNPEIIKSFRTNLRYPKSLNFAILFLFGLLSLYAFIYFSISFNKKTSFSFENYSKLIYSITLSINYMFFFYVGTYLTANSLSQEKEKKTFDFIRISTIPKSIIVFGKLVGTSSYLYLLSFLMMPFILVFAFIGKISLNHLILDYFNLFIFSLLFFSFALFSAVIFDKPASANSFSISIPMLTGLFIISPTFRYLHPFYALFSIFSKKKFIIKTINFYNFEIFGFLLIAFIIFFLSFFLLNGVIRKIEDENIPVFSKKQAFIFTFISEFILIGFYWDQIINGIFEPISFIFIINLFLLTLVNFTITPKKENFIFYLNNNSKSNFWDDNKPTILSPIFLSIIVILFIGISVSFGYSDYSSKKIILIIYYCFFLSLFSTIYQQLYYYFHLLLKKNASFITVFFICTSLILPFPIKFIAGSRSNFEDLFGLNPLISFFNKSNLNLPSIIQSLTILIFLLLLNFMIVSKQNKLKQKHKI